MRNVLVAFWLPFAVAGCTEPQHAAEAKEAVAQKFAYPSSVTFRRLHQAKFSPDEVCGEAKGRLESGEMSDWRPFLWDPKLGAQIQGMSEFAGTNIGRLQDDMRATLCD